MISFFILAIMPLIFIAVLNWFLSFFAFKTQPPLRRALMTTGASTFILSLIFTYQVEAAMPVQLAGTIALSYFTVLSRLAIPAALGFLFYYLMLKRRWVDDEDDEVFD